MISRLATIVAVGAIVWSGCGEPSAPQDGPLATGRWSGGGACLNVADAGCELVVGCGHGRFSRPTVRADGTFDVDGTYRIEAGPISIDPAPPAHFSGKLSGANLMLDVVPTNGSPAATYSMTSAAPGNCAIACL